VLIENVAGIVRQLIAEGKVRGEGDDRYVCVRIVEIYRARMVHRVSKGEPLGKEPFCSHHALARRAE